MRELIQLSVFEIEWLFFISVFAAFVLTQSVIVFVWVHRKYIPYDMFDVYHHSFSVQDAVSLSYNSKKSEEKTNGKAKRAQPESKQRNHIANCDCYVNVYMCAIIIIISRTFFRHFFYSARTQIDGCIYITFSLANNNNSSHCENITRLQTIWTCASSSSYSAIRSLVMNVVKIIIVAVLVLFLLKMRAPVCVMCSATAENQYLREWASAIYAIIHFQFFLDTNV